MSRRRRLLTQPPLPRRALKVSEPEATATSRRRRLNRRRDSDVTAELGRWHGGMPDSPFVLSFGLDHCCLRRLARLDAIDQPFGVAAVLARHLARNITIKVDAGAAGREAFLVHQTIDVSLQCGVDLPRAEHAARHQVVANADL